jgi:dTDP-4-dehydrorhamnose 3,5-epimerase-like enzyme
MQEPSLIKGGSHSDTRGTLTYNNDFDGSMIKRIYVIENKNTDIIRAWQGHKVEQRWFSVINGSFKIKLIKIDNWEQPFVHLKPFTFKLKSKELDVLHIPAGYVSSVKAMENDSKLLVMADYLLGKINDEYRYPDNYFRNL